MEFEFSRPYGDIGVIAQVRIRYCGAGGTWTPWSPEYDASVPFVGGSGNFDG